MNLPQKLKEARDVFERWQKLSHEVMSQLDHLAGQHFCPLDDVGAVQATVARYYSVPVTLISADVRTAHVALARHVAMFLARRMTNYSDQQIAACFRRERGIIAHACKAIRDLQSTNKEFNRQLILVQRAASEAVAEAKQNKIKK